MLCLSANTEIGRKPLWNEGPAGLRIVYNKASVEYRTPTVGCTGKLVLRTQKYISSYPYLSAYDGGLGKKAGCERARHPILLDLNELDQALEEFTFIKLG